MLPSLAKWPLLNSQPSSVCFSAMQVRFSHRIFALFGSHAFGLEHRLYCLHSLCAIPLLMAWSTYCNCRRSDLDDCRHGSTKLSLSLSECSLVLGLAFSLIIVPWQHSCEIDVQILESVFGYTSPGLRHLCLSLRSPFHHIAGKLRLYTTVSGKFDFTSVTMRSEHFKGFWVVSCKLKTTSLQIFHSTQSRIFSAAWTVRLIVSSAPA